LLTLVKSEERYSLDVSLKNFALHAFPFLKVEFPRL